MRPFAFVLCLALLNCGPGGSVTPHEELNSKLTREMHPNVPPADLDQVVADNSDFGFALQRAALAPGQNAVASPFSVSQALAMTWAGARGETAGQMAQALRFTLPAERFHPAFNALDLALSQRGGLKIVNALWGQQDYPFLEPFLDTLMVNYGAGMNLVDFRGSWEDGRATINDWVAQQTKDRIQELIPSGVLDEYTRLVLTNAITFDGAWEVPFDERKTVDGSMQRSDGSWAPAKVMHREGQVRGVATADLVAAELPYEGGELSMVVVAPRQDTLAGFESALASSQLDAILQSMTTEDSALSLPRFKIAASTVDLGKALKDLGMTRAFDGTDADFSAMADLPAVDENLYVQAVLHKAYIAVGEKGTEAAAATAVVMGGDAGCIGPVTPPERRQLTFDRPFLFLIRDVPTGAVLFLGHVVEARE